jgi:Tfp pilus assembly protein PilX
MAGTRNERGIALVSALFALVAVSLLISGVFAMTDL